MDPRLKRRFTLFVGMNEPDHGIKEPVDQWGWAKIARQFLALRVGLTKGMDARLRAVVGEGMDSRLRGNDG